MEITPELATRAHQHAVDEGVSWFEERCARAMRLILRRFAREASVAFERHQYVTAAATEGDPEWRFPMPGELLDETDAQAELEVAAKKYRDQAGAASAKAMTAELGISFDLSNRLLHGVIASQAGMHITTAPRDLVTVLMHSLQKSYDDGASIPKAARAMRAEGYTHAKGYAERIARTELVRATNEASLAMVRGATTIQYKEWMATGDNRTRPSHRDADGQTVPVNQAFVVGGHYLDYPGDPAGPGDEVIQCRCTLGYTDAPSLTGGAAMAATDTTTEEEVAVGASWFGPIAQEGVDTGDGRRIEPGALNWRPLPLTMMGQKTTPAFGGHEEAQVAGRIDTISRSGANIDAAGIFDTGEWGADIERLVREGMLNGVSVDLAINEAEVIPDPEIEDPEEAYWMGTLNVLDGTILGATIVPFPAFENAQIAIVAGGAMRLRAFRTLMIDGKRTKVCSFFMPFSATFADDETDPQDATDDAAEAIADITDAVNGWPGLDGDVVITISGAETTVAFPPATDDGSEPGEASVDPEALAALEVLRAKLAGRRR